MATYSPSNTIYLVRQLHPSMNSLVVSCAPKDKIYSLTSSLGTCVYIARSVYNLEYYVLLLYII